MMQFTPILRSHVLVYMEETEDEEFPVAGLLALSIVSTEVTKTNNIIS